MPLIFKRDESKKAPKEEEKPPIVEAEIIEPEKKEEPKSTLPAIVLDKEVAKAKLADFLKQVDEMFVKAKDMTINNDQDNEDATALGTRAKKLFKAIQEMKVTIPSYVEARDYIETIDEIIKMACEKLDSTSKNAGDTVVSLTKKKISQWNAVKESERRKAEALAKQSTEELNKKLQEQAVVSGTKPVEAVAPIIPKGQKTVRTESGSSHVVKRWTFEIERPEMPFSILKQMVDVMSKGENALQHLEELKKILPYCSFMFEDTRIRRAVKEDNVREIPGIKIYEDISTAFRTR